ncbi:low molecular weight phosphotyrosine protein phosphatase-like [Mercenaria mercenaria]|uniref:low molecular weight phosphotyrosine protein phosphatase-like n=1 Tax=Mercenaria mercenaria TaxID=6596 RepID=UPI00234EE5AE|nr:low molecular weight phosphotyrosine protein phosphatase-like [Mercenaria mercenaria]
MASSKKKSVLFICLGNICRSPIAEAVFLRLLNERGVKDQWEVDSAALGTWHIGKTPDSRARKTLKNFGVDDYKHKARAVNKDDFTRYDVIFGMDEANMEELEERKPSNCTAKLKMLGEYDPEKEVVIRDPYYDAGGDLSGFEKVYEQCVRCCTSFLDQS